MSDEYDGKDLESLNNKLFMSTGCEAQGLQMGLGIRVECWDSRMCHGE